MNDRPPAAHKDLAGRTLLVGVCGGIAAYKCAEVVSTMRQAGADVHVIMTEAAQRFVTPLTFQALSNNDVHTDMFGTGTAWEIAHIGLVRKTDAFLVLNATANTLAKLAHGIADNLLTTCVLATRKPVLIAPAMNTQMLEAAATQENIRTLHERGMFFIEPGAGFLACGEVGQGRLADPDTIVSAVEQVVRRAHELDGLRVMITAGPTREFLDPSRFLSNPSTGRMGFAMAAEAHARGAEVTVICGPTELRPPASVHVVRVTTAREMQAAVMEHLPGTAIFVGAAAVADFRPAQFAPSKVRKADAASTLVLERNPDVIAQVAERKPPGCFIVGFAAETDDAEQHAREKLLAKKLDCIVTNRIAIGGGAFGASDNEVVVLWGTDGREALPRASKPAVAAAIWDRIMALRPSRGRPVTT
ncbi:MAG: bifunctional phosphopantothenoylcysteine decarboxylase/phosphopantothenate--cysteine ligase CoaBC [Candidatus Eremiobacteraeota bacterium]|nr:bifunctional phosphopantothenoylcysteine decarboxylase/phosphopantothenate--cysteine ligase CoaBC [Candidatus Eremiobacteraeota bacterium]MBV8670896.1 bifunctional phosphopantothenoylcysteine decarboxylase/phosphopantothenate--cysteine ligase CoaBC [Candidatus Eremiobacteraeota bacterium]